MRKCNHCEVDKPLKEFHTRYKICRPCKSKYEKQYRQSDRGREAYKRADKKRREKPDYQEKRKARMIVNKRIEKGLLVRGTNCEKCNSKVMIEAHHEDYSKPLEIVWLCQRCHKNHHKIRS